MNLRQLILLNTINSGGGGTLVEKEATGNPVVFNTNVAQPIVSILIPLDYSQTGNGDPSPDNIRPIAGLNSVSVQHNSETYNIDFPDSTIVYSGSLDVISGELNITHAGYTTTWGACTNNRQFTSTERRRISLPFVCIDATSKTNGAACNVAPWVWDYTADYVHFYNHQSSSYVFLPISADDSTEIQIVGKLASPVTIQLTQEQIAAVVGTNTIESNTTGDMSVIYITKE